METATDRRRRGLPRAEQVARNRADLLSAAGRVFRELGYSGASLDAIADVAGFSKGAVYSHFASKADLFLSLLESRIEERAQLAAAEALRASTPSEFVEQVFAASRADPQWQLAVLEFRVVAARDPELRDRYAQLHQQTVGGVEDALRRLFASLDATPALPVETLAVVGLILDVGVFLEGLASATLSDQQSAALFSRVLHLPQEGA